MNSKVHEQLPSVDIVIVNFNSGPVLSDCLPSVLDTDYPVSKIRFLVVDNGSTDGSADFLDEAKSVFLVRKKNNRGFGAALEASRSWIQAKYVVFLNEDIRPQGDWLRNLVRVMEQHPEIGIAGAVMRDQKGGLWDGYYYSPWLAFAGSIKRSSRKMNVKKVPYVGLGSCIVRTECLNKLPISKLYFLYCEDIDFAFKVWASGFQVAVINSAILYHIHQASIRRNLTEFRSAYYLWRNNLWIPIIFFDPGDLLSAIIPAVTFRLLQAIILRRERKQVAAAIYASLLELPARLPVLLRYRRETRSSWRIRVKEIFQVSDRDPFMSIPILRALATGASRFRHVSPKE
jgi:GT2 family glycosyltransferase